MSETVEYCIDKDCERSHCLWGEKGDKRRHIDGDHACGLRHCYGCFTHRLPLNSEGFVLSWYCYNCRKKRRLVPAPQFAGKKSIAEIQQRLKEMAEKAPKSDDPEADKTQEAIEEVFEINKPYADN
jgi:hypothetical protein